MAIMKAMGNTTRCARGCNGSTTKNAIVYFPPGNYLVSSTIAMPFGTQVIGDANTRPTLVAAPSFVGLGVLSNDEYTGGDGGDQESVVPSFQRCLSLGKLTCATLVQILHQHFQLLPTDPQHRHRHPQGLGRSARDVHTLPGWTGN